MTTSTGARGAASEMIACAYLIGQGFHVFRAVAPSCPVDLVAWRVGEQPILVEVKTASRPPNAPGSLGFAWPRNREWQLLIVIGPEGLPVEITPDVSQPDAVDLVRAAHGLGPARRHPLADPADEA